MRQQQQAGRRRPNLQQDYPLRGIKEASGPAGRRRTERLQKESEEFFDSPLFCISALALLSGARTQADSSSFAEKPSKRTSGFIPELCLDV